MLKGIIGYSDYSFAMVIFECFRAMEYSFFFLKSLYLLTEDFGFWLILKICILHFLSSFSNDFANNVFCNQLF